MNALKKVVAAAAVAGIAGIAYAQTSHQNHGTMPMGGMGGMDPAMQKMMQDMMPSPSDPESTKDFKQVHKTMMKDMHQPLTGNADVDFRVHMIPHHQGAIDMAKVALKHAKDPETKTMAQAIIAEQEKEIAAMQAWLKKQGK